MKTSRKLLVLSASRGIFVSSLGAVALLLPNIGHAQETWRFDPTFQRTPLRVTSESVSGVKVLSSGKVLMHSINGYLMSGANGQRIGALVRIDPNTGAIDPTWHPDPTLTGFAFLGVAEALDGKIYYSCALAGEVANPTDPAVNRLIRLNTDGSRDTSFNSPVFAFLARFLGVQTDGKIIVCSGGINLVGVPPADSIVQTVRLNTDGTLDTTFQSPNFQQNATDPPASVASGNYYDAGVFGNPVIDSTTGKIYFCGTFRFVNGQPRKAIVRCNADGTLDSSFVPTGLIGGTTQLLGRAMVLQAGGKVVLCGTRLRTAAGGATRYALLRFNDDGTLDPAFTLVPTTDSSGTALFPGYFGPSDIKTLPGGKILTTRTRVLRFLEDGTLDPSFTPLDYSSPYFSPNFDTVAAFRFDVNPNTGEAYLPNPGPLYARLGGVPVPGEITKLKGDGTIDTQFNSPVVESEDFAPKVQIAADSSVFVSGAHTAFGSTDNATIGRLLADGTRDPSYSLDTLPFADKQAVGFALLPDSAAYVVYASGSFNAGYQFSNLVRLLPTGAIDTNFRPSSALQTAFSINAFDGNDVAKSSLADISTAPLGKLYLFPEGSQATVNGNGNLKPTRVNTDGSEDTTVPPLGFPVGEVTRDANGITGGSTGYVHRLAQTPNGGFIILASVAPFPTTTGNPYNFKLIRLLADGSQDPNFASPLVTSNASPILNFPVLFDPVTGFTAQPPNGFYDAGQLPITSAASFPDGSVLLTGKFLLPGDTTNRSLAKLTPTGALDPSFSVPSSNDHLSSNPDRPSRLFNARVSPDGKIWVLGRFDTLANHTVPGVARLNADGTFDNTFQLTQVAYYDSYGDFADVIFADNNTAYLLGTFRRSGEPMPFAVTRIVQNSAPVITNPLSATATGNQQFIFQVLATDATSLNVTNLPPGLTYDSALHAIVGIPTAAGTFQVVISATNADGTTNATLTLTIQPPPPSGPIITSSTSVTGRTGSRFIFQVFANNVSSAARLNVIGLPPGLTFDPVTGVISGTVTSDGTFGATVIVTEGNDAATSILELTFSSDPTLPVITSPSIATLTSGAPFFYQITAPATSDPNDPTVFSLIGTLPNGLTFDAANGTISGTYTQAFPRKEPGPDLSGGVITNVQLFATNSHGTTTLPLIFLLAPTGVGNISTRLSIGQDANVLIGGFIINGTAPKKVLIRAAGPSLAQFGITNALTDPMLELHDASQTLGTNDDWHSFQEQEIIDSTLAPRDSREPAIIAYLNPGAYTAIVKGKNNTTGIGTMEVYDLGTASLASMPSLSQAKLANISSRGFVQTNDNVMIGGFIITGATTNVIVRSIGPELTNYGVAGALQDTMLDLVDANGHIVASNDDWRTTQEQAIIATTLAPKDDREAALIASLNPGGYTAIVRGKNGTTGVATVEMYSLP